MPENSITFCQASELAKISNIFLLPNMSLYKIASCCTKLLFFPVCFQYRTQCLHSCGLQTQSANTLRWGAVKQPARGGRASQVDLHSRSLCAKGAPPCLRWRGASTSHQRARPEHACGRRRAAAARVTA